MGDFITFIIILVAVAIVVLTIYYSFKRTKDGDCLCGSCKNCKINCSEKEKK